MVNLTRIYTRAGDDGATRLGDNSTTRKTDPRLAAYADVDEANSAIGVALADARSGPAADPAVLELLEQVQNDLFDVGADLATPVRPDPPHPPLRVTRVYVEALEAACDRYNAPLGPLRSFILPGGSPLAARLHVARTVVRRAERSAWAAVDAHGDGAETLGGVNVMAIRYLNRLSDLLFIMARTANAAGPDHGDVLWRPGARTADEESLT